MSVLSAFKQNMLLLVFTFVSCSLTNTQQPLYVVPPITVSPTYHYDPVLTSEIHPHITAEVHPNIIISNTSDLAIELSNITLQCIQKVKETLTPENYEYSKNLIAKTLWHYRYALTCSAVLGSYSMVSLFLINDYYRYLQDETLWARWKPECTFECLCTIPHKDLTQELLTTINTRYYHKDNPTKLAHPLTMFITAIEKEITTYKRYIAISQTIQRLKLIAIFPTNPKKIDEVKDLLQRALFIKHLFLSWLSDYNITHKKKSLKTSPKQPKKAGAAHVSTGTLKLNTFNTAVPLK